MLSSCKDMATYCFTKKQQTKRTTKTTTAKPNQFQRLSHLFNSGKKTNQPISLKHLLTWSYCYHTSVLKACSLDQELHVPLHSWNMLTLLKISYQLLPFRSCYSTIGTAKHIPVFALKQMSSLYLYILFFTPTQFQLLLLLLFYRNESI